LAPQEEPLSKRFDKSRRLFEATRADDGDDWRDNEIARKQAEQKEKDMQVTDVAIFEIFPPKKCLRCWRF
jgi:hypothetical protein